MCKNKEVFVFVYGTLKKDKPNYLGIDKAVMEDSIDGTMFISRIAPFPFVSIGTGDTVLGEVHLIDAKHLSMLDRIEGEGQMYDRKKVITKSGRPCYVYDATRLIEHYSKRHVTFIRKYSETGVQSF